jgi:hypothetical protein
MPLPPSEEGKHATSCRRLLLLLLVLGLLRQALLSRAQVH